MFNCQGQIALVTGASRGIGASIADTLGQAGGFVVGTATSERGVLAIKKRFEDKGIKGDAVILDVSDRQSMTDCFSELVKAHGAPSILVNNAGITRDNLLLRMKEEDWDNIINTNLSSVFSLSKMCIKPMMKARFGRIITISSVVGVMGNPGQANYAAAKAGVIGFSKSLGQEVASRGITVNVIAPGFIATDMTQGDGALDAAQQDALLKSIPMSKMGKAEDIANAVLFLASKEAGYITGQTLHVNGGMLMV